MSRDFFESDPPPSLDQKIQREAAKALQENARSLHRRRLLQWSLVPVFAAFAAALFSWRFQSGPEPHSENLQAAEFVEWNEVTDEDFEAIADLELLEDLDVLESWKDA